MDYRPDSDPRNLGQDPEMQERARRIIESVQQETAAELAEQSQLLEMFEHPGWAVFVKDLERHKASANDQMTNGSCKSLSDYDERRGRIKAFDAVLNAPHTTRMSREVNLKRLRQVSTDGSL